uniref:Apple domain-containing protein n=1 Tax=Magallana gigas TaxID=29159 RepID=A0A8W8MKA0_MAGGI
MDEGVFAVHTLEIKSLIECALRCGMNLLCNAVDFCFLDGLYTCRFRYGHANLSNTITQCEAYENTASKDCPDGLFLRAQGICKISKWMPQSNNTIIKVMCLSYYSYVTRP